MPKLKYSLFEQYSNNFNIEEQQFQNIISHPRHTYDSLSNTFNAIQLLTQTLSNVQHNNYQFVPITQHRAVHQKVKHLYKNF